MDLNEQKGDPNMKRDCGIAPDCVAKLGNVPNGLCRSLSFFVWATLLLAPISEDAHSACREVITRLRNARSGRLVFVAMEGRVDGEEFVGSLAD